MSKKAEETEPRHRDADKVVKAIKPNLFEKLRDRVTSLNTSMKTDSGKKAELISDAVDIGLHSGAFGVFMRLRKMDPVKRNEFLFHFELYCEWEGFAREELYLGDREPSTTDADGDRDMRPRHLRQPGASAAEAVQKLAEESGAKTRPDEDNLRGVGRGKQNPESPKLN